LSEAASLSDYLQEVMHLGGICGGSHSHWVRENITI
jgi:hypothetical protein